MNRLKGILMIIGGSMFWGATGPMMEWILNHTEMTAEFMMAVRLIIAGFLILGLLRMRKQAIFGIWKEPFWRNQLVMFSIIGMVGLQYTFVKSIDESNAVVATLLQFLAPIFIIFYVSFRQKRLPPKGQVIGIMGTLVGLYLLLTNGSLSTLLVSEKALMWGVLLGFTYAFYTLYPVRLMNEWGVLTVVGWGMILSGIVFSFMGQIWSTSEWTLLMNPNLLLMMLALVFFGSAAFVLFLSSLKYITAVETSILSSFEPLTAMVISVIWLGSFMQLWQLVGVGLMLIFVAYLSIAGGGHKVD